MGDTNHLIFISIAAYRDQQLVPTIKDCLATAKYPDQLRFGICWQHDPQDPSEPASLPYASDDRFRILDVDYRQSKGACWARAAIMELWNGEAWFLQIDSHCRFAPHWDAALLREIALTGSPKPLLSTYASAFTPGDATRNEVLAGSPQLMAISSFNQEGLPHLKPVEIPGWQTRTLPMRARFLAAGFLFTSGEFIREVGYDPELYFFGEEIAMTLRAFTHGYDLFHPYQALLWHDYVRSYARRHWQDHADEDTPNSSDQEKPPIYWKDIDSVSRDKILKLLSGSTEGRFGLGPARSLADYETYAGISFAQKKVHDYTLRSLEAPNPEPSPTWTDEIYTWLVRVMIDPTKMSPAAFDGPAFWYVAIQDEDRNEIHRHDFSAEELAAFTGREEKIALVCEIQSGILPAYWTVWPVSKRLGWLSKLQGKFEDGDYAIVHDDEEADDDAIGDEADDSANIAD